VEHQSQNSINSNRSSEQPATIWRNTSRRSLAKTRFPN